MKKQFKPVPDVEELKYHGTKDKPDIKIFVSHRIDLDSETVNNPLYIPVRCGAVYDKRENVEMLGDDTGINISEKRNSFCECTVHYWAWKNVKADYYGLCHYRRYIGFSSDKFPTSSFEHNNGCVSEEFLDAESIRKFGLDEKSMREEIEKYDVIAIEPINIGDQNNYDIMKLSPDYHNMDDVDIVIDLIEKKYPDMINAVEKYMRHTNKCYLYNCWILTKEIFCNYSEWLFTILNDVEKTIDNSNYSQQKFRTPGTLAERLWGIYLTFLEDQKKYRIGRKQLVFFKNVEMTKELFPAFNKNNYTIVSNFNNTYVPVFSALLASIVEYSSENNNYDIIILGMDIDEQNKKDLISMIETRKNFSLRFYNPNKFLYNLNAYVNNAVYTSDMYTRVLVPHILKNHLKVLVIDADTICQSDLADLLNVDLEGNWAGAVKDTVFQGYLNGAVPGTLEYAKKTLKLKNPYLYCNTGVILFDCEKYRAEYGLKYLQNYISTHQYKIYEQDTLNVLLEGKIKFLNQRWNVYSYTSDFIKHCIQSAPQSEKEEYIKAREHPGVIHFAAHPKPWWKVPGDYSSLFWKYARKTPFYEVFISMLISQSMKSMPPIQTIQDTKTPKSAVREAADILLPTGSKRRSFIKILLPRDSFQWKLCQKIYYLVSPCYRNAQKAAGRRIMK